MSNIKPLLEDALAEYKEMESAFIKANEDAKFWKNKHDKAKEQLLEIESAYNVVSNTLSDAKTRVMQLERELASARRNAPQDYVYTYTFKREGKYE